MRLSLLAAACVLILQAQVADARDWFVQAGASGDGTQKAPFGDPWQALAACEAGDKIHVTEGRYFGRQECGVWEIPFPRVQLLGGYTKDFSSRDPWKHFSELVWKEGSKNRPKGSENRISGKNDDHSGCRVDGFVIDMREQNEYIGGSMNPGRWQPTPISIDHPGSVIANNIILNASWDAIHIKQGVTVENNLIVNAINASIHVTDGTTLKNDTNTQPAIVRNNTIAFTWSHKEPGKGGQPGSAIQVLGPVVIDGNVIMNADNHGIYVASPNLKQITVKDNVFFMNLFSNIKLATSAMGTIIDDKALEDIEEVGFKVSTGNAVKNPEVKLDKDWMDKFSQRSGQQPGQVEMDEWNKYRQTLGLPLIAKGGKAYEGLAPPWELAAAQAFFDSSVKQGAHRKTLAVEPFSSAPAGAAGANKTYEKSNLLDWASNPEPMIGKAVEITVAVGMSYGITYLKVDGVSPDTHEGVKMHDPSPKETILALFKKGTSVARAIGEAKYISNTSSQPQALYTVKGTVVATGMVPRAGIIVDSFAEQELKAVARGPRPLGRDWFVRQGSKGGDGSQEKPFKDPYFALDRAEAGDTIHVAEGDYNGKLKAAQFKIDMPYITLLGGYDKDFKERDPWKHPTLLRFIRDAKNDYGQGFNLEGEADHTGAIVDGFVFDRRDYNNYQSEGGDILRDNSNRSDAVYLSSPGSTVRNCVFLNGAGGALVMATGTTTENNIFINFLYQVITIRRHDDITPAIVRNNTILFSWNDKFGAGNTTQGYGIKFDTGARGVADRNVIHFVDNHAIEVFGSPGDVSITNNVFNANLFSNFQTSPSGRFIDDQTMGQFKEAGLKASEGNVVMNANFPIDPKWFEIYSNRTGTVPGKVTMDDWNKMREIMGLPLIATGGKGPSGFSPMYDYKKAVLLFPKNDKVDAGAKHLTLPVKFEGVVRQEPVFTYEDADWAVLSREPAKLEGKRVSLKVAIVTTDNQWNVPGVTKDDYTCVKFQGQDLSGLPKRFYVKKGTRHERVARRAKILNPGEKPKELYLLKGMVHKGGEIVADAVEVVE